ncbi:hypothetical protein G9A89_003496 [Geosiphon pyriformis]|nr:hypothetical protein G9A89_003496 [Geosiphon pyriformis]
MINRKCEKLHERQFENARLGTSSISATFDSQSGILEDPMPKLRNYHAGNSTNTYEVLSKKRNTKLFGMADNVTNTRYSSVHGTNLATKVYNRPHIDPTIDRPNENLTEVRDFDESHENNKPITPHKAVQSFFKQNFWKKPSYFYNPENEVNNAVVDSFAVQDPSDRFQSTKRPMWRKILRWRFLFGFFGVLIIIFLILLGLVLVNRQKCKNLSYNQKEKVYSPPGKTIDLKSYLNYSDNLTFTFETVGRFEEAILLINTTTREDNSIYWQAQMASKRSPNDFSIDDLDPNHPKFLYLGPSSSSRIGDYLHFPPYCAKLQVSLTLPTQINGIMINAKGFQVKTNSSLQIYYR